MSKTAKLESYLNNGGVVTARQITGMFGLKNPARAINYLRSRGVCVYSNPTTLSTGERVVKYRVGRPTRRMVAIANAVAGAEVFSRA